VAIRTVLVAVHAALRVAKKAGAGLKALVSHGVPHVAASQTMLLVRDVLTKAGQMTAVLAIKVVLALGVLVRDGLTRPAVKVAVMQAGVTRGHVLARADLLAAGENLVVVSHRLAVSLRVRVVGLRVLVGQKVALGVQHARQLRANLA